MLLFVDKIHDVEEDADTQTITLAQTTVVKHPVLGDTKNKEFYYIGVEPGTSKAKLGDKVDLTKVKHSIRTAQWLDNDGLVKTSNWISLD